FMPELAQTGRAIELRAGGGALETNGWVATENRDRIEKLFAVGEDDTTLDAINQGWMESIGPTTATELAARLQIPIESIDQSFGRLEAAGLVLRGRFRVHASRVRNDETEWCHRRLLARIHRLTIGRLRKEVEPVTAAEFMRFLLQWQHVTPGSRQHGEAGLLEVVKQLAGFETAASAWESQILRLRLAKYEPELLDRLCLSGAVSWGRLSPHPRLAQSVEPDRVRRIVPTSVAPISLFPREEGEWLLETFHDDTASAGAVHVFHLCAASPEVHQECCAWNASLFCARLCL